MRVKAARARGCFIKLSDSYGDKYRKADRGLKHKSLVQLILRSGLFQMEINTVLFVLNLGGKARLLGVAELGGYVGWG